MRVTGIIIVGIVSVSLFSCKTEDIILHGDITGLVTDASTGEPVEEASVKIIQSGDSTLTGSDGTYQFRNINPGQYEIQASKFAFATYKKNATIAPAEPTEIDFPLIGIPEPNPSPSFLDFRLDSTTLSFSISNSGKGKFTYVLTPSQTWITISPAFGDITNETDNISVTINKTGLSESIYKESIKVTSFSGPVQLTNIIIPVYLNGALDRDGNYYKVVKIGTQTWMAENLNVGITIDGKTDQADNGIIEKYCNNCNIYGGLYQWYEMMQYNPSDDKIIGTTQGICPDGWHVPTLKEWDTLTVYLGGLQVAGGMLKEKGLEHWLSPNFGATNESGFTGLAAGYRPLLSEQTNDNLDWYKKIYAIWWSSTPTKNMFVRYDTDAAYISDREPEVGRSVRCVKNPGK